MYNNILKKQIAEYIGNKKIPKEYAGLFKVVSEAYDKHEQEKKTFQSNEITVLNQELKQESIEIQTLFQNIEIMFFSIDMTDNSVNQMTSACEKIYGYKPEDFMNDRDLWKKVVHPDDVHIIKADRNLAKGRHVNYQYRIIHKDKSIRWIDSKKIPTLNDEGLLVRVDGVIYDITDKKMAEENVVFAEHLLSEAQQLGKMGNWNINILNNEMFWSNGLKEIMGMDKDFKPEVGDEVAFIHPEDMDRVKREITKITITGEILRISYRIKRKNDSEIRTLHSVVHTRRSKKGNVERIYGTTHDITEQYKTEEKLEQYNLTMYQISHDLRGPLNSAKNYIYLALKRVEDKMAYKYLIKIHNSYNKMEHRVLSLLDFQRLNRTELNIEKLHAENLIKDVLNSIELIQGYNEVEIQTNINVDFTFYSDKQFLHSIIHNLVSNAINYRQETNAYIGISAFTDDNDIVLKVEDNGKGIPQQMKGKLFERFCKDENSASGTGLGLYIVRTLVDRLGGSIDFESEEMKGTTFTLRIPTVI